MSGMNETIVDRPTFEKLCNLVYKQSGILLKEGKESLVAARLGKRIRELGLGSLKEYLHRITTTEDDAEITLLLDSISTNVTSFFREPIHFEFLRDRYREWLNQGQTRFRFWSAASSTGEEPYSLAMTLLNETLVHDLRILATDISTRVLQRCIKGIYEGSKVSTVPPLLRERYFHRSGRPGETTYQVSSELQRVLLFKRLNLSKPPFPMKGPLDAILIRNVMIYFDKPTRQALLREAKRLLRPGGYLIIGHSDSLMDLDHSFRMIRPSIYQS